MNEYEIKQLRLHRQHITNKSDKHTVCHDLNGLQSQFTVNVYYGLKIRCNEEITPQNFGDSLVKNWTIRGTVHAFNEDDLPLFKHNADLYHNGNFKGYGIFSETAYMFAKTKEYYAKEVEEYQKSGFAWSLTPERQKYFSQFIIQKVSEGICTREELKQACLDNGMTLPERDSMFDQWGGGMRELCERGFLCYKVCEKKEFMIPPDFTPINGSDAETEIARRYFGNFAPAAINDFAYYYGCTLTRAKELMSKLPLENFNVGGKDYFYMGKLPQNVPDIPKCVLLAGFDQLMLGYKKEESIFLPHKNLRGIFNLAGIVMPPVLLNGTVVGRWRKKNKKVLFELFEKISDKEKKIIENTTLELYNEINKIEWKDL
ncbi:MAG: winged helix DNA-binding domain-containing protein [Ruminococcus sp.]|nr:winged helix DNA-binding domain-containing protein [Ruminococcus sp.]MBD5144455.1 winged helix DNA-binding domain-containing protein [Ruminococcus sp.]